MLQLSLACGLIITALGSLAAVESTLLAEFTKPGSGAAVRISLEHTSAATEATLVSEFTISAGHGWHFYSTDLPESGGADGTGRPAKVAVPDQSVLRVLGPRQADVALSSQSVGGGGPTLVYPAGPVTIRQPVQLPLGDGALVDVDLQVWYMICDDQQCLRPVQGDSVTVQVPTVVGAQNRPVPDEPVADVAATQGADPIPSSTPAITPAMSELIAADDSVMTWPWWLAIAVSVVGMVGSVALVRWPLHQAVTATPLRLVAAVVLVTISVIAITRPLADYPTAEGITWTHVAAVDEVRAAVAAAHADGRAALLDFTGPACANCQEMAKNIFIIDEVRAAWNSGLPIEIDTDTHTELEEWQGQTFGTWNRPLYIRIEPGRQESEWTNAPRWDARVTRGDEAGITAFIGFLQGNDQQSRSIDDSDAGWLGFVLLAMAGGLFTLVMPCTYPMIPFTVTFFSKQAAAGRRLVPLAACYALGIIGFFAALGLLVGAVFGAGLTSFAGSPIVNLIIGILFVVFGLSLLGLFLLRLPAGLETAVGGGRGGYLGALLMGLTFAITAFTCTAPFAGLVLGEAASDAATTGTWVRAVIGMMIYASMIAIPFFFLSISPGILNRMPRAGAWMSEFKVVGGLVEIGAALKFLAIADVRWEWGLITRTPTLAVWSALALVCGIYISGLIRFRDDAVVNRPTFVRWLLALCFMAAAAWLASGLTGSHLGIIESFFPADDPPLW